MFTSYETDNLIIKICDDKQAGLVADFYDRNFEDFSKYEPLTPVARTVHYHKKNLQYERKLLLNGEHVRFYLFEKNNPMSIIGTISYRDIKYGFYDSCIIGYKIDEKMRGRGYCKEGIRFCDRVIFAETKINRIEATVQPTNEASKHILSSLGYTNEGLLREKIKINGQYIDHYLFAILRKDIS